MKGAGRRHRSPAWRYRGVTEAYHRDRGRTRRISRQTGRRIVALCLSPTPFELQVTNSQTVKCAGPPVHRVELDKRNVGQPGNVAKGAHRQVQRPPLWALNLVEHPLGVGGFGYRDDGGRCYAL